MSCATSVFSVRYIHSSRTVQLSQWTGKYGMRLEPLVTVQWNCSHILSTLTIRIHGYGHFVLKLCWQGQIFVICGLVWSFVHSYVCAGEYLNGQHTHRQTERARYCQFIANTLCFLCALLHALWDFLLFVLRSLGSLSMCHTCQHVTYDFSRIENVTHSTAKPWKWEKCPFFVQLWHAEMSSGFHCGCCFSRLYKHSAKCVQGYSFEW